MPTKLYPTNVIEEAQDVLNAWGQIGDTVTFGDLNKEALSNELNQVPEVVSQLSNLEIQMTDVRNTRDALYQSIWDKVKRIRSGVKGIYGDDSTQYEMVGGTRKSERKTPARKTKTGA